MKKITILLTILIFYSCLNGQSNTTKEISNSINTESSTYYFVRHAEKNTEQTDNPDLLPDGEIRAANYANYFKNIKLDAVYSSNFTRTLETAKPTANAQNLETIVYNHSAIDYKKFLEDTKNQTVFIVGHSNTIPNFVNTIIGENFYDEIDESIYNHLYIVTLSNFGKKHELKKLD